MSATCETCLFWLDIELQSFELEEDKYGLCRAYAPRPGSESVWWPHTKPGDWCGEHEERLEVAKARADSFNDALVRARAELAGGSTSQEPPEWWPKVLAELASDHETKGAHRLAQALVVTRKDEYLELGVPEGMDSPVKLTDPIEVAIHRVAPYLNVCWYIAAQTP